MKIEQKKILILSPHTDDAEIGAGGAICQLAKDNDLYHAAFSFAKESLLPGFADDATEKEFFASAKYIGIPKDKCYTLDYKVRVFSENRQRILEDLVSLKRAIEPDVVITTSSFDTHQDHKVLYEESFRAFKDRTILGYEMPSNNRSFAPNLFVPLSDQALKKKIELVNIYQSQVVKFPGLENLIRSLAVCRGYQIKKEYAEAFEVIRLLI